MTKVAAFYQFTDVPDPAGCRAALQAFCESLGLFGTVLLAPEGINGTLAGAPEAIDALVEALQTGTVMEPAFTALELKFSRAGEAHFDRLKIKVKREIITFNQGQANPLRAVGTYVSPADWNAILDDPGIVLIDTRNGFEVQMGSFPGALDPRMTSFSDFPDFVAGRLDPARDKKIAMFCTGGIRCEKASAYMLAAGFETVYHLQGGILKYLEDVPETESRWSGDCFVFDRREALGHGLVVKQPNCHANFLDSARQSIAE